MEPGAFICSISERDWEVTREQCVYGNKEKARDVTTQSIIRDLVGMRVGDTVFFHVIDKKDGSPSEIHGVYRVKHLPYFNDKTTIWKDSVLKFPHRFMIEPHPDHIQLCKYDAYVSVTQFYQLIELRKIWSLATLESEQNIEARSVRKIASDEVGEITKLLYRDFSQNHSPHPIHIKLFTDSGTPLPKQIGKVGQLENAVKGVVMHKLSVSDRDVLNILGPVDDFLNEVFIAQTTRKAIDVLCIGTREDGMRQYTIIEFKTDWISADNLEQLLTYLDLFRQRLLERGQTHFRVKGCLIGQRFRPDVSEYVASRNKFTPDEVILVTYSAISLPGNRKGDATFALSHNNITVETLASSGALSGEVDLKVEGIVSNPSSYFTTFGLDLEATIYGVKYVRKIGNSIVLLAKRSKVVGGLSDYVMLGYADKNYTSNDFTAFMVEMGKIVISETRADYMQVEPIIVAPTFDSAIIDFVSKYNMHESRKKIKLFGRPAFPHRA